jgi:hypothetical protein
MKSLLHTAFREELRRRSRTLRPDSPARWGRFTAPTMLSHVIQSLRVMSGEVPMPDEATPWIVRHAPLKHLLIYVIPFPKGLPTSTVLLERASLDPTAIADEDWQAELHVFADLLDTIGARPAHAAWPSHAAFGLLTGQEWGVLQYRHLDHHFRQFGV